MEHTLSMPHPRFFIRALHLTASDVKPSNAFDPLLFLRPSVVKGYGVTAVLWILVATILEVVTDNVVGIFSFFLPFASVCT